MLLELIKAANVHLHLQHKTVSSITLQNLIKKGAPGLGRLYIWLLFLPLLFSCATTRNITESQPVFIIESVPFYPQEKHQCGPASLAGVLNFLGINITPDDIAKEIYSKSAKGTPDIDMLLYVHRKGMKAGKYKGNLKDIKNNIDSDYPVIVLVDYGFWVYQQNHFMVVVGYNKNGVIVNSGKDRLKFIPEEDFMKSWKRTGFWTLLIKPD